MVIATLDPEHASLVVALFFVFLVIWVQFLIRRLVDALDLRTALRTNAIIRMDQLGRLKAIGGLPHCCTPSNLVDRAVP